MDVFRYWKLSWSAVWGEFVVWLFETSSIGNLSMHCEKIGGITGLLDSIFPYSMCARVIHGTASRKYSFGKQQVWIDVYVYIHTDILQKYVYIIVYVYLHVAHMHTYHIMNQDIGVKGTPNLHFRRIAWSYQGMNLILPCLLCLSFRSCLNVYL